MKAGRELDALIAEKVMGFDIKNLKPRCLSIIDDPLIGVPSYSTSISDAWEVVEKLASGEHSGYGSRPILLRLNTYKNHPVWCEFWLSGDHAGDDTTVWISQAETASLAICLAALKAVE